MTLREWRAHKAMSIRDLAEATNVSTRTIMDIEHGKTTPQPRTVRKLTQALGVQPADVTEFVTRKDSRDA